MITPPSISEVAKAFCEILKEWHTPEQMAEVVRRNQAETDPIICHSHDFFDANQAMIDAWQRVTGQKDDEVEVTEEPFYSVCGEAWNIAKAANFNL